MKKLFILLWLTCLCLCDHIVVWKEAKVFENALEKLSKVDGFGEENVVIEKGKTSPVGSIFNVYVDRGDGYTNYAVVRISEGKNEKTENVKVGQEDIFYEAAKREFERLIDLNSKWYNSDSVARLHYKLKCFASTLRIIREPDSKKLNWIQDAMFKITRISGMNPCHYLESERIGNLQLRAFVFDVNAIKTWEYTSRTHFIGKTEKSLSDLFEEDEPMEDFHEDGNTLPAEKHNEMDLPNNGNDAMNDSNREAEAKNDLNREAEAEDDLNREAEAKDDLNREAEAKDDLNREAEAEDGSGIDERCTDHEELEPYPKPIAEPEIGGKKCPSNLPRGSVRENGFGIALLIAKLPVGNENVKLYGRFVIVARCKNSNYVDDLMELQAKANSWDFLRNTDWRTHIRTKLGMQFKDYEHIELSTLDVNETTDLTVCLHKNGGTTDYGIIGISPKIQTVDEFTGSWKAFVNQQSIFKMTARNLCWYLLTKGSNILNYIKEYRDNKELTHGIKVVDVSDKTLLPRILFLQEIVNEFIGETPTPIFYVCIEEVPEKQDKKEDKNKKNKTQTELNKRLQKYENIYGIIFTLKTSEWSGRQKYENIHPALLKHIFKKSTESEICIGILDTKCIHKNGFGIAMIQTSGPEFKTTSLVLAKENNSIYADHLLSKDKSEKQPSWKQRTANVINTVVEKVKKSSPDKIKNPVTLFKEWYKTKLWDGEYSHKWRTVLQKREIQLDEKDRNGLELPLKFYGTAAHLQFFIFEKIKDAEDLLVITWFKNGYPDNPVIIKYESLQPVQKKSVLESVPEAIFNAIGQRASKGWEYIKSANYIQLENYLQDFVSFVDSKSRNWKILLEKQPTKKRDGFGKTRNRYLMIFGFHYVFRDRNLNKPWFEQERVQYFCAIVADNHEDKITKGLKEGKKRKGFGSDENVILAIAYAQKSSDAIPMAYELETKYIKESMEQFPFKNANWNVKKINEFSKNCIPELQNLMQNGPKNLEINYKLASKYITKGYATITCVRKTISKAWKKTNYMDHLAHIPEEITILHKPVRLPEEVANLQVHNTNCSSLHSGAILCPLTLNKSGCYEKWREICCLAGYNYEVYKLIQYEHSEGIHFFLFEAQKLEEKPEEKKREEIKPEEKNPDEKKPEEIKTEEKKPTPLFVFVVAYIENGLIVILKKVELNEHGFARFYARRNFLNLFNSWRHTQTIMERTVGENLLYGNITLTWYDYSKPKHLTSEERDTLMLMSTQKDAFKRVPENDRDSFFYYKSNVYFDTKYHFVHLHAFVFRDNGIEMEETHCTSTGNILPYFGTNKRRMNLSKSKRKWKTVVLMTKANFEMSIPKGTETNEKIVQNVKEHDKQFSKHMDGYHMDITEEINLEKSAENISKDGSTADDKSKKPSPKKETLEATKKSKKVDYGQMTVHEVCDENDGLKAWVKDHTPELLHWESMDTKIKSQLEEYMVHYVFSVYKVEQKWTVLRIKHISKSIISNRYHFVFGHHVSTNQATGQKYFCALLHKNYAKRFNEEVITKQQKIVIAIAFQQESWKAIEMAHELEDEYLAQQTEQREIVHMASQKLKANNKLLPELQNFVQYGMQYREFNYRIKTIAGTVGHIFVKYSYDEGTDSWIGCGHDVFSSKCGNMEPENVTTQKPTSPPNGFVSVTKPVDKNINDPASNVDLNVNQNLTPKKQPILKELDELPTWRTIAALNTRDCENGPKWMRLHDRDYQIRIHTRLVKCKCVIINKASNIMSVKYLDDETTSSKRHTVVLGYAEDSYFFIHEFDEVILFFRQNIRSYLKATSAVKNYLKDMVDWERVEDERQICEKTGMLPGILYYANVGNFHLGIFPTEDGYKLLQKNSEKIEDEKWIFECRAIWTLLRIRKSYIVNQLGLDAYDNRVPLVWVPDPYPGNRQIPEKSIAWYNLPKQFGRFCEWGIETIYRKWKVKPQEFKQRERILRTILADQLQQTPGILNYGIFNKLDENESKVVKAIDGTGEKDLSSNLRQIFVLISITPFVHKNIPSHEQTNLPHPQSTPNATTSDKLPVIATAKDTQIQISSHRNPATVLPPQSVEDSTNLPQRALRQAGPPPNDTDASAPSETLSTTTHQVPSITTLPQQQSAMAAKPPTQLSKTASLYVTTSAKHIHPLRASCPPGQLSRDLVASGQPTTESNTPASGPAGPPPNEPTAVKEIQRECYQVVNAINFMDVDLRFYLGGYSSLYFPKPELAQDATFYEHMLNGS